MKFELTEIVAAPNPEEVLRVLEQHLRAVAGDVVRSDGQVTAFGIGPSPRTVNRRDTTVIEGRAVDGTTVLQVRVTYQASALLGNMPQDDIVRSKIEDAIDEVRGELKVWKAWGPPPGLDSAAAESTATTEDLQLPRTLQQERTFESRRDRWPAVIKEKYAALPPENSPVQAETVAEALPAALLDTARSDRDAPLTLPEQVAPAVFEPEAKGDPAEPDVIPTQIRSDAELSPERPVIRLSKTGRKRARRLPAAQPLSVGLGMNGAADAPTRPETSNSGEKLEKSQIQAGIRDATAKEVPLRSILRAQDLEEAQEARASARGRWKPVLAVALILVVATGGAGYAFRDVLPIPEPWKLAAADLSAKLEGKVSNLKAIITGGQGSPDTATLAGTAKASGPIDAATSTVSDPEVMIKPESNIYAWVQDWAAAMRSRDPVAQASYYAGTVDHYLNETAVSHDSVLQAKKDGLAQRVGLWSVKVEHVFVESQNSKGMSVRLIKRTFSRDATGSVSDRRMKVRLRVVRVDGTWKIVDEQELGPPASASIAQ